MQRIKTAAWAALLGLSGLFVGVQAGAAQTVPAQNTPKENQKENSKDSQRGMQANTAWEAKGTLFEACSCSVPCPCNFGQPPTRGYCHTIYAYRIKAARYQGVALDGLVFGGGEGPQGAMGFVDARATPAQRPILEKLALAVFGKGGASGGPRKFTTARIGVNDSPTHFELDFGDSGGFAADTLIGADGKNPIIVENNTTWPVRRFIKGKTTRFDYHDALGNRLHFEGVNANLGEFTLSGSGQTVGRVGTGSCCAPKVASRK